MSDLPAPLVPQDVDLTKIDAFMLDTVKLLGSELVALSTGEEFKAAVLLWCRAWHQKPAASLPNDDRVLASFAMVPLARWRKIKSVALRGFVRCSDGRLYHKVLSEDARKAWQRVEQRRAAIRSRYEKPTAVGSPVATKDEIPKLRTAYEKPTIDGTGTGQGRDGTGTGRNLSSTSPRESARAAGDPPPRTSGTVTAMRRDWQPSPEIRHFAALKAIPDAELARQAELFRDHYLANGELRQDWDAAFRKWLNSRGQFEDRKPAEEPQRRVYIP